MILVLEIFPPSSLLDPYHLPLVTFIILTLNRDVCDIGQMLFWGKTWVWYATAVMFVLNNTFIQVIIVFIE